MSSRTKWRAWAGGAGLVAAGVVGGGILASALTANAADTPTPTPTSTSTSTSQAAEDPSQSHHGNEQLLTGDTKTKVEAAVLGQYPNATIERTESDQEGVYESHIVSADGQHLNVQVGADFAVTGTDAGHGGHGHRGGNDGDADD